MARRFCWLFAVDQAAACSSTPAKIAPAPAVVVTTNLPSGTTSASKQDEAISPEPKDSVKIRCAAIHEQHEKLILDALQNEAPLDAGIAAELRTIGASVPAGKTPSDEAARQWAQKHFTYNLNQSVEFDNPSPGSAVQVLRAGGTNAVRGAMAFGEDRKKIRSELAGYRKGYCQKAETVSLFRRNGELA